jgi:hypothetical protein
MGCVADGQHQSLVTGDRASEVTLALQCATGSPSLLLGMMVLCNALQHHKVCIQMHWQCIDTDLMQTARKQACHLQGAHALMGLIDSSSSMNLPGMWDKTPSGWVPAQHQQ